MLVDCWHQLRVERVAARLQERVGEAAMEHYRSDIQHLRGHSRINLDLAFNNVKPKDWYFVLD